MGLMIALSPHLDRKWFTTSENASGTLIWDKKCSSTICRIVLYLEGVLRKSVRRTSCSQDSAFSHSEHVLFVQQKILHPSESVPLETSRTTLGPGRHIFAFDLNFPDTSSRPQSDIESCTRCRSSLPQCFAFRSDVLTVSVSYRLRAVIERPGLLKSNITTIQNVEYYPLLSSVRTPTDELGPSEITTRASAVALGIKEHGSNHATITLPPYSPSVMVQIASAASRTIRPGDFLHLEIALSVPAEPQQILGLVWLCNLTIRLKATTMAAVGPYRQRDVTSINVCNVSGLLPLEMSSEATQINLPSVLWQDYIYPSVIPSFQLCGVGRSYQLEVVVGFACHYTTNIFTAKMSIDTTVESGAVFHQEAPPDYD